MGAESPGESSGLLLGFDAAHWLGGGPPDGAGVSPRSMVILLGDQERI
jgi:hypothetical protein